MPLPLLPLKAELGCQGRGDWNIPRLASMRCTSCMHDKLALTIYTRPAHHTKSATGGDRRRARGRLIRAAPSRRGGAGYVIGRTSSDAPSAVSHASAASGADGRPATDDCAGRREPPTAANDRRRTADGSTRPPSGAQWRADGRTRRPTWPNSTPHC